MICYICIDNVLLIDSNTIKIWICDLTFTTIQDNMYISYTNKRVFYHYIYKIKPEIWNTRSKFVK